MDFFNTYLGNWTGIGESGQNYRENSGFTQDAKETLGF